MIIHSFDEKSEPIITPATFYGPQGRLCEICILTFSPVILSELRRLLPLRRAAAVNGVDGEKPVYLLEHEGRRIAVFQCGIGSTLAGGNVEELNWITGATKFLMFGSAGSLDRAATEGKYVIPTEAYRDEGMSYHYAPPADYIRIKNAERLAALFEALGLPYVEGRVWTTDAFYRETRDQLAARRREGCIAVEMETAGVQAVCDHYGLELYAFLVTGDVLDAPSYEFTGLPAANHDLDKLWIALEIAKRI
jgi:uridine phosphorylase